MRILVTGGSGFVGSNLVHVFAHHHDAEVLAPSHDSIDVTDRAAVRRFVADTRPEAVVHASIWNDPTMLASDRRRAWKEYVGATRSVVDAANDVGARVVLISADWVFDGTQGPAAETEPPNPINPYGFLKAASELVVTQRAARSTVARIAGVQGVHRAHPHMPRRQDAGFGYLVASLVEALRAGERFTIWDGGGLNKEELLDIGAPPAEALAGGAVPRDTRLDAAITADRLGTELPDLDTTLARLRHDLENVWSPA